MGKQALRWLLGAGYVILVTLLLLYQMGVIGKTRNSFPAVLGTLILGIALAVVLVLYMRVTDQLKARAESTHGTDSKDTTEISSEEQDRQEPGGEGHRQDSRSYEETYETFVDVMQGRLSERELEVAWLLYCGYTNRQIGEELYIAETTVKKHVTHIYQKMEVYSRKDFRARVQEGHLTPPQTTLPS